MYIYIENVITETTHFPIQPQNIYSYSLYIFFIIFDFPAKKKGWVCGGRIKQTDSQLNPDLYTTYLHYLTSVYIRFRFKIYLSFRLILRVYFYVNCIRCC